MNWQVVGALLKAYFEQALRMSELEARVAELERRLRAGEPYNRATIIPAPMPANRFAFGLDPDAGNFAPLGVTLYRRGERPEIVLFPEARNRIFVVGVDEGDPGGGRASVVMVAREANPDAEAPTKLRVVSTLKESPDRATSEPEEA